VASWHNCSLLVLLALLLAGCGPRPVTGGTAGTIRIGGAPMSEVQVTVHQPVGSGWEAVGFGVAATDGSFELVTSGAAGPLALAPGTYRCTLESVGAPLAIAPQYTEPGTTPLEIAWPTSDGRLTIDIPAQRTLR
jgi:hypothetical protein